MLLLALACAPTTRPAHDSGPYFDGDPTITSVTWACDTDGAEWDFEVTTEHWSGGGVVWMARDAENIEKHSVPSKEAAPDGSTDRLALSLSIVPDWRDATLGSSTRWLCSDEPSLSFLLEMAKADGSLSSDCRTWGANPTLWGDIAGATACKTVLEPVDTGAAK